MKSNRMRNIGLRTAAITVFLSSLMWSWMSLNPLRTEEGKPEIALNTSEAYRIESQRATTVWPAGTEFEPGRASYFYVTEPLVTIQPTLEATGLTGGTLEGQLNTRVELQARNDKEGLYWSYLVQSVASDSYKIDVPGTELPYKATPVSVDVNDLYQQVQKIGEELKFQTAIFQILITTEGTVEGSLETTVKEQSFKNELKINLQPSGFSITNPEETIVKTVLVPQAAQPTLMEQLKTLIAMNPLPLLSNGLGLISLFIVIYSTRKGTVKAALEHKKYKEWITEGYVDLKNRLNINVFSLSGLVDLAIDLDKRVIYDSKLNLYVVLTEDMVYSFTFEKKVTSMDNRPQLGKLLIERNLISPEQLETGLFYQTKFGSRLGESLIALGFIDETTLYSALASQQGFGYYELNVAIETLDLAWLSVMDIHKAKALQAIPLGQRADGKWIIVCSEPGNEGTRSVLKELFTEGFQLMVTRPSGIYDTLEKLALQEHLKSNQMSLVDQQEPFERLSFEERQQFVQSYLRGILQVELLLKSAGVIDPLLINQKPAEENLSSWLVNKNYMKSEVATLLKGLEKVLAQMEWQERKAMKLPELLEVLLKAHFITPEALQWIQQEAIVENDTLEVVMIHNYMVSATTMDHAKWLLETLENLLAHSNQ